MPLTVYCKYIVLLYSMFLIVAYKNKYILEVYPSPRDGYKEMMQNTVKHVNEPRIFRETHQPYSLKQ